MELKNTNDMIMSQGSLDRLRKKKRKKRGDTKTILTWIHARTG